MAEANHRLQQAPNAAQVASMRIGVFTLAHREAYKIVKRQMQAKGLKVALIAHREIAVEAQQYLARHPELFESSKATIERWFAEGKFGPRGALRR